MIIEYAKSLATVAHVGQRRKDGVTPYIEHPRLVAQFAAGFGGSEEQIAAAWLHDVIEDCEEQFIRMMYKVLPKEVTGIVEDLTNRYTKEKYPEMNRNARKWLEACRLGQISPESAFVKECDILANATDNPGKHFFREKDLILQEMPVGSTELRHKIEEIFNEKRP